MSSILDAYQQQQPQLQYPTGDSDYIYGYNPNEFTLSPQYAEQADPIGSSLVQNYSNSQTGLDYPSISNTTGGGEPMPLSQMIQMKQLDIADTNAKTFADLLKAKLDWQNSWQNQYLKPVSMAIGALTSLGNVYLGYKQYGIAKEQLGLAKEKWNMTKDELNRISKLRTTLTNKYMGKQ